MDRDGGERFSLNPALVGLPTLLWYPAELGNATLARIARKAGPALATITRSGYRLPGSLPKHRVRRIPRP